MELTPVSAPGGATQCDVEDVQLAYGVLREVAAGPCRPLVVLLDEDGANEAEQCGRVGEDPDDVGAAFDLFVETLESLNYRLRKVTKNRGHVPNDDDAIKMLWLAICNIENKRARERAKERGCSRDTKRKAEDRLVEGSVTTNWKQALAQLVLVYLD